jgi:dephospho-CoA kinase
MAPRRPDRLEWPEEKRPRRVTFVSNGEESRTTYQNRLWTDKYVPQASKDLAIAPKKVNEVSSWMKEPPGRLMILVGSPGIGKSTMVQCLAKEQKINVAEWTETTSGNGVRSFEAFLQHANLLPVSEQRSIILVDEIPNLYGNEVKFRDLFTQHVRTGVVPTVLIFSDTIEGKSNSLDQIIDAATLYDSSLVQIIQIHPPTKARFKRALKRFSRAKTYNNDDDLYDKTGGDLRYALCMLQSGCQPHFRDTKLSGFHALGKLLYAKRNGAGEISFDPELVMSSMESAPRALSFLQYHSLGFYTSLADIAEALHSFSDASIMTFGSESVAARTVAATNRNPAMTQFKQLSAPPAISPNDDIRSLHSLLPMLPLTTLATDFVPFLRRIDPQLCLSRCIFSTDVGQSNELELERERDLLHSDDIIDESDTE